MICITGKVWLVKKDEGFYLDSIREVLPVSHQPYLCVASFCSTPCKDF